jgi:hypothetical protein
MMKRGSSLSRRAFLGTATAAGVVGLAGCTNSSGSSPAGNTTTESAELKIARLTLSNRDDEPHTVAVTITESGESVFHVESEVESAEYENGRVEVLGGHLVQGTPTEPGAYVIRASVDDREEDVFRTSGLARQGIPCIPVDVQVDPDGSLSMWYTTAKSYCE